MLVLWLGWSHLAALLNYILRFLVSRSLLQSRHLLTRTCLKVKVEVPAKPPKCKKCNNVMDAKTGGQVCPLQDEIDALRKAAKKKSAKPAPAPKPVEKVIQVVVLRIFGHQLRTPCCF